MDPQHLATAATIAAVAYAAWTAIQALRLPRAARTQLDAARPADTDTGDQQ